MINYSGGTCPFCGEYGGDKTLVESNYCGGYYSHPSCFFKQKEESAKGNKFSVLHTSQKPEEVFDSNIYEFVIINKNKY